MSQVSVGLRTLVRERAAGRCEYCRKPEGISSHPYHADHVIALKHGGATEPDNLAWACFHCNSNKGTDLSTYDWDSLSVVSLYNPRSQVWDEHFKIEDGIIIGLTPAGRVTAALLQMNASKQVETRRYLVASGRW